MRKPTKTTQKQVSRRTVNRRAKPLRVGVIGLGRGQSFVNGAELAGMQLVALCDTWEERLREVCDRLDVTGYTDYDKFLEHDMDAVVLANYFHEHAPFAIKALKAGKHVMSETSACMTLAQGVELIRTVEETKKTYLFAENYPYSAYNQEMRRLFQAGTIGDFLYGEGEYVHPDTAQARLARSRGWDHWRNWLPITYYCTHSLGPVMFITDTWPVKVNGFVVPRDMRDDQFRLGASRTDTAAMIMVRMDNAAVVKIIQGGLRGHQNYVRIHGNRGLMENLRAPQGSQAMLRVFHDAWDRAPDQSRETIYTPEFPAWAEAAKRSGHGGGDFFMNTLFVDAIRTGKPPFMDVYRGVAMSAVGIQAWRSTLADSAPVDVPDFRKKTVRKAYENDHWSPDPATHTSDQPWPSILGDIRPTNDAKKLAKKIWK